MLTASRVNDALTELAQRLEIPCDIIAVHRTDVSRGGKEKKYASLRYGAFLLAYAPLEAYFDDITGYRSRTGRTLGLSQDKIRHACQQQGIVRDATRGWAARTRVAPTVGTGRRSPWALLQGQRLRHYLDDMKSLRNLLSHGADPRATTNLAATLHPLSGGGHSIRLMGVEGFIQAAQDLASETAIAIHGNGVHIPEWPAPPSTGASDVGRLRSPY